MMHMVLDSGFTADVDLEFSSYTNNGNTAIIVVGAKGSPNDGEHIAVATVNFEDVVLNEDEVAIKDYSENSGMIKFLVSERIVEPKPVKVINRHFVSVGVYKLTDLGMKMKN